MRWFTRALGAATTAATAALVLALAAGPGLAGTTSTTAPVPTTAALPSAGDRVATDGVTRTVLAVATPANAAGQVLVLTRVTVAPGRRFAAHAHPGTQVLRIQSGTLALAVESGTVPVTRADGTTEDATGPTRVVLRPGDSWVEAEGVVHSGRNRGATPVVALSALLVAEGAGLSTPVGADAPGTPLDLTTDFTVTENRLVTLSTPGGSRLYGTAIESATATVAPGGLDAGQPVRLALAENIDYANGSGPWSGFLTATFADDSTIVAAVTGATVASADGGAQFAGTMVVLGGTGRYAGVTGGTGTYTGGRSGALGATPLPTRVSLRVLGV